MTKKYVLGLALDEKKERTLLIQKNRPEWQKGLFNGIGGKIEEFDKNENFAIKREFLEETGIDTNPNNWHYFCQMDGEGFNVKIFYMIGENLAISQKLGPLKIFG